MLPSTRSVLRVVLIVLARRRRPAASFRMLWVPIAWIILATFLAIALSGPVNILARRMRRGLAITVVYLTVLLVPIALAGLIVPPLVRQGVDFVEKLPQYSNDLQDYVQKNKKLRKLNDDLGLTDRVNKLANDAPNPDRRRRGRPARPGSGPANSIFAGFTIFVLSIFMVGARPKLGRRRHRPAGHRARGQGQGRARPHRDRGRQLRRRRDRPGDDRRGQLVRDSTILGVPVCRRARGDRRRLRPDSADRRDGGGGRGRPRDAVRRLPDGDDRVDRSSRSPTSSSRTT